MPINPPKSMCTKQPICNFMKCNTNDLARGSLGPVRGEGIFRDNFGCFRGGFSHYIGIHTKFYAELMAPMMAIEHTHSVSWSKMWLECDSRHVLHAFTHLEVVPWTIRSRWKRCINLTSHMNFHVSYIFREGNKCVDKVNKSR